MKYRVGDVVRIVDSWPGFCGQNSQGHMDHWLGKPMTIRTVVGSSYYMKEDSGEGFGGGGWTWFNKMIAGHYDMDSIDATKIQLDKFVVF